MCYISSAIWCSIYRVEEEEEVLELALGGGARGGAEP